MKKLSAVLVACMLVLATAFSAFAAGINENEQAVLDELKGTITMNGVEMSIPSEYINQAESYFNTIDMTAEESAEIISILKESESYMESTGASNISDMTVEQKETVIAYGKSAVAVVGMTMSYDTSTKTLTITDANGETSFSSTPTLTSSSDGNSGTITTTTTTTIVSDGNVIKTTGLTMNLGTVALFAGAALVVAVGCTYYLVKMRKERA